MHCRTDAVEIIRMTRAVSRLQLDDAARAALPSQALWCQAADPTAFAQPTVEKDDIHGRTKEQGMDSTAGPKQDAFVLCQRAVRVQTQQPRNEGVSDPQTQQRASAGGVPKSGAPCSADRLHALHVLDNGSPLMSPVPDCLFQHIHDDTILR